MTYQILLPSGEYLEVPESSMAYIENRVQATLNDVFEELKSGRLAEPQRDNAHSTDYRDIMQRHVRELIRKHAKDFKPQSLDRIAKQMHINPPALSNALNKRRHFSVQAIARFCKITGLTLTFGGVNGATVGDSDRDNKTNESQA